VATRDLEALKRRLTRADDIEKGRPGGRRRRATALVMYLLAKRGFVVVPALPAVESRAARRVPRLPGSRLLVWLLARRGLAIVPDDDVTAILADSPSGLDRRLARIEREFGLDHPEHAETMSGFRRLANVEACVTDALRNGVPGDLIETGVWRGGTTILMRALLDADGDPTRRVWVADSFEGLPKPDAERYPADKGVDYTGYEEAAVGVDQVKANFADYGLLDDRVEFLVGWFKDTLPSAPIDRLAVMRLDGDLYESTMNALESLYPKLSVGGYCIVDDYGVLEACRRAVDDYRAAHGITEEILPVDWTCVYWQRERA